MVGFIVWLPPWREPNKPLHLYDLANQHFLASADAERVDAFLEADKLTCAAFHSDAVHHPTFLRIYFNQSHSSTFDGHHVRSRIGEDIDFAVVLVQLL